MSRIYFTDRDLGKQFPRILADVGITVERQGATYSGLPRRRRYVSAPIQAVTVF